MIIINGKKYKNAKNVTIRNGEVIIDGVKNTDSSFESNLIKIEGNIENLITDESVHVNGNVNNLNAGGSVKTNSASGKIVAGGSVKIENYRDDSGIINAGGSVKIQNQIKETIQDKQKTQEDKNLNIKNS